MTKLTGSLPKGDSNGLDAIARRLIDEPHEVQVLIVLADCKKITTDLDTGEIEPTARIRRIEAIEGADKEVAAKLLRRRFEERTGKAVLPFDLEEDLRSVFSRVDPETGEKRGDQ
jgi:hypothetical protein